MHCLVYEYEVEPGVAGRFEQAYGPHGDWARFFHTGAGFLGTELLRDCATPVRYVVVDRWSSAATAAAFLSRHAEDYARRAAETADYYRRELRLGAFDVVDGR